MSNPSEKPSFTYTRQQCREAFEWLRAVPVEDKNFFHSVVALYAWYDAVQLLIQLHQGNISFDAARLRAANLLDSTIPTTPWQGGLTNTQLEAALRSKLSYDTKITDKELSAFALGIEWGRANVR